MDKDITNLVERLEAFEERFGITLEGLFAKIDESNDILVNGEIHPREGTQLSQDIEIVISAHDSNGRVLEITGINLFADSFFGFESFSRFLGPFLVAVSKIRIYPKA